MGPDGLGSDVKEPENNRIINVSEMSWDNSTQTNHVTRFGSGILYPTTEMYQKYSLDTILFEYLYPSYHILYENTQKY